MIFRRMTVREQKIFMVTMVIILVYGIYAGIYKPLKRKSEQLSVKMLTLKKSLSKNLKTIKKTKYLEENFDDIFGKYQQTATNEQVKAYMVEEIKQVAQEIDLQITDIKPKRVQDSEHYNQFSVSLTINSNFEEVVQFLHLLQNDPHDFYVDEMRFDKASRRKSSTIKSRLVLSKILVP